MHISDNFLLGPVVPGGNSVSGLQAGNDTAGPSPQMKGIGPMGRVFTYNIVPATLGTALLAALQTTAGAGSLTLAAGAGITAVVDSLGVTRYQLDVPRCLTLTSAANISAVTFTISGYDIYGQAMSQAIAGPNANTVTTTKAFYQITGIAVDAAVGTNTSVGTSDTFGIPIRVDDAGYLIKTAWNNTLAQDAGTFVAAVSTDPATTTTGDVRGTFKPSANASNGSRRLCLHIHLTKDQVGPAATRALALGVTQA